MSGRKEGAKVVVVRKKVARHGGHHGGSWKVAYADFVTAMMAFFMVMWIMGMDQGVKDMVQGYFTNPVGFKKSFSAGTNVLGAGNFVTNLDVKRTVILNRRDQERSFQEAAEEIRALVEANPDLAGVAAQVEIVVTEEGLRIELMEDADGAAFFDVSSAALKPALRGLLRIVGGVLDKTVGDVVVEGHTDARPYGGPGYSNWELSVERANAARRDLEAGGLKAARVTEVRGYADRQLKEAGDPFDAHNRRISVLLPFAEEEGAITAPPAPAGALAPRGGGG
ncbi:MAG TPA: flagellar motor protein MotB [Longimicrobiales bacterium]|nr:flagellar motor protein MotB [Longimicrobiales bacterium]